jgi:hypothetical protein
MRSSFAALLLLLIPHLAHAGPWLKDTGAGYAKLSTTYFQSEGYYRASEETDFSFSSYSLSLYSEIGLPGPFQAIVQIPFVFAANSNASDVAFRNADFGDGRFSLEWAPWDGLNLVVGMDLALPLYTPVTSQQLPGELSAWQTSFPDLGDGNYDLTTRIDYGLSLSVIPGWLTGSAGYRKRFGYYVDGIDLKMQLGVWVFPNKAYLSLYSQALLNVAKDPEPTLLTSRETVSLEVSLGVTADPLEKNLHLVFSWGTLLYTRFASPGYSLTVGVAYSWDGV